MAGLARALMEIVLVTLATLAGCSGNEKIEVYVTEDTSSPNLGGYYNVRFKEGSMKVLDWQVNQGVYGCQEKTDRVMNSFTTSCNPCEEQLIATVNVWNTTNSREELRYFDLDVSGFCAPGKSDSTVPIVIGAVLASLVVLAVLSVLAYRKNRMKNGLGPNEKIIGPGPVEIRIPGGVGDGMELNVLL